MAVRLLHPPSLGAPRPVAGGAGVWDPDDDLARLYAHDPPSSGRAARVRANLVTTLDGAVAGADGSSRSISGPTDLRVLVLLRSLADVVLVGAGTVRTEGYGPLGVRPALAARRARLGMAPSPVLGVVSRSGRLPDRLLAVPRTDDGEPRVVVLTCAAASPAALQQLRSRLGDDAVVVRGDEDVDLSAAVDDLASRGLRRVLCEGGPALLRDVVAAGLLDELCLTTSPLLVAGAAPRALVGDALVERLELASLLLADDGGGTLLGRWTVRR